MLVDPVTCHISYFPFMKRLGVALHIPIVMAAVASDQPNAGIIRPCGLVMGWMQI
jgi:hypothetical protein